jgi:hypothetical protein
MLQYMLINFILFPTNYYFDYSLGIIVVYYFESFSKHVIK